MTGIYHAPNPDNVKSRTFAPGTEERALLKAALEEVSSQKVVIPAIINGQEVYTDDRFEVRAPHDHSLVLAECCRVGEEGLKEAIETAMAAKDAWELLPREQRYAVFLKAANLVETKYRYFLTAVTMLGQSKTANEASFDAPDEVCDLLRYNVYNMDLIYNMQPKQDLTLMNRLKYRPLEGFVCAVTPFNFASICANLPAAPATAGNVVVWKPSTNAVLISYYLMKIFMEAGLPAGVINFVPSRGSDVSNYVLTDRRLGGFHFTGSTRVFRDTWKMVGENIDNYRAYPRLVGETGGKDYCFATENADVDELVTGLIRGAFEYQGQKCSALSRAYIPAKLWPEVKEKLLAEIKTIRVGDVKDFRVLMGAVIDRHAFNLAAEYIDSAKHDEDADLLCGSYDDSKGLFIYPTVIQVKSLNYKSFNHELFSPILSIYVYEKEEYDKVIDHCANSSKYALTGCIYTHDRSEIAELEWKLRDSAGNWNINDKPAGALTGHQPFGGARGSGTNDKAGNITNMFRWVSPQSIKENMLPFTDYRWPSMAEE